MEVKLTERAILYDATRCTACRGCQVACKQWNENDEYIPPPDGNGVQAKNWGSYENPPDLSRQTWLKMEFREVEAGGKLRWLFTRRSCMHCTDASCIRVCPNESLYHNESGFVSYNKDTCTGCGYCVDACPFHVPRRKRLTGITAKIDKCTFCTTPGLDRIAEGLEPACVKTCPTDALIYGDRDKLVAEGRKRVEATQAKGWNNAYLYGEKELDGLHVLYLLDDSPAVYGLPVEPQISAAIIAWQSVIQPIGWAVLGLTAIGLGVNYLVAREAKAAKGLPSKKEEK
ncbi:4Fe-4S dicluster domain-containing protein [Chloroflexota bacterium]